MASSKAAIKPREDSLGSALRVAQIMRVMARHGILGALRGRRHWPPPSEVRKAFEDLGVVFIKFAQVLALRRDILPVAYVHELERLHDRVPALPFAAIRAAVERQLGRPLKGLFRSFNPQPLAQASIAQVHEARTKGGRHVAVKVRRPGLEAVIGRDIATLHHLAAVLESLFPRLIDVGLSGMVTEFERSLHREVDFSREARNMARIRASLGSLRGLWIPETLEELSADSVLTMTYSPGKRIDLAAKRRPAGARRQVALLLEVMMRGIFEEGVFHADPHPGNVFVLPDGRLCLLDFGMVGEFDEPVRQSLKFLLRALVDNDPSAASDSYLEMARSSGSADRPGLRAGVRAILQDIHGLGLEKLSFGNTLAALLKAGSENGFRAGPEFFLLTRIFLILESELQRFAPGFDYRGAFERELKRLRARHFGFRQLSREAGHGLVEMERLMNEGPGDARRVLRQMADGRLGDLSAPGLEAMASHINRDIQQLSVAVAAAALTVGGSMLGSTPDGGWRRLTGDITFFCGLAVIAFIGLRSVRRFLAARFASWGPGPSRPQGLGAAR